MVQGIERRRQKRSRTRLPQALKVILTDESKETRSLAAKVADFSGGGIGLDMFVPLPPGAVVEVKGDLRSEDLALSVRGVAKVAHSRRERGGIYRIGLELQEIALRKPA